ncbi:hypothetical protein DUNSADRAFT_4246 [Dunaliella salina]|uniref:Encoded protein n=1 Tax=Dunaliella salina TaxID=3046 RepID=A0ABQ7GSA9_DUNSA|nr:hypothetical protein DUNSADRAFT_4246 [Dunaliella salina]|eukprot:KAF5837499.1 hypothetical protein DUNSADRAFT_4246 [Dunaliella salina]
MVLASTQQPQQSRHLGLQKKLQRNTGNARNSLNLPAQPESQSKSFPGLLCLDGLLFPDGCVRVSSEGGTQRKRSTAICFTSAPATPAASCQLDPPGAQREEETSAPCTPSVREVTTPRNRAFGSHRACYFSASKPAPSVPSLPIKRVLEDAHDGSDAGLTTTIMPSTPKCSRRAPPNPFADDAPPSVASSTFSTPHPGGLQPCSRSSSFAISTNPSAPLSCSSSQSLPQQPQEQQQHRPAPSGGSVSAGSSAAAASAALDSFLLMGLPSICCPQPSVLPPSSVCFS